jgi:hypothetical protein
MPYDLLLFPLVAGYYLIVTLESRYKYIQLRFSNQKLLFNAAIVGILLSIFSFVVTTLINRLFPQFVYWFRDISPIQKPFFGTSVLTLILSFLISKGANRFLSRTECIIKAIDIIGNELELIIKTSFQEETLLLISLKNNKFYIGWVSTLPIPNQSKYISIIPAFSGFRDDKTKELRFVTQYLKVYSQYIEEGQVKAIDDIGVNLVINIEEILTVSHFSIETYERFGKPIDYSNSKN